MLQNRNFPVQRYVCISPRGPLPPLDLELYSRVSQVRHDVPLAPEHRARGHRLLPAGDRELLLRAEQAPAAGSGERQGGRRVDVALPAAAGALPGVLRAPRVHGHAAARRAARSTQCTPLHSRERVVKSVALCRFLVSKRAQSLGLEPLPRLGVPREEGKVVVYVVYMS